MVFTVTSEVSSTARTREANARSASEVCLEYSHGLPSLPGTLTAEVLRQFSEELVRETRKTPDWSGVKMCVPGALGTAVARRHDGGSRWANVTGWFSWSTFVCSGAGSCDASVLSG